MEDPQHIRLLLSKYIRREKLTASERAIVEEWLGRSEHHRALVDKFRDNEQVWNGVILMQQAPVGRGWQRLEASLDEGWKTTPLIEWDIVRRILVQYAAAVVLVIAGAWGIREMIRPTLRTSPVSAASRQVVKTPPPIEKTFNSRRAISSMLDLSDSSQVILSYASNIRYPASFEGANREVSFSGRAYFNITSDSKKPFIIHVEDIRVEVLGTEFLITAYPREPAVQIALFKGAVRLYYGADSLLLGPNEQVRIEHNRVINMHPAHREELMAWSGRDPRIFFDQDDLSTVLREIARCYDVSVVNPGNIKGKLVTGKIQLNNSLKQTLRNIERAESHSISLQIKGKSIIVSEKPAAR